MLRRQLRRASDVLMVVHRPPHHLPSTVRKTQPQGARRQAPVEDTDVAPQRTAMAASCGRLLCQPFTHPPERWSDLRPFRAIVRRQPRIRSHRIVESTRRGPPDPPVCHPVPRKHVPEQKAPGFKRTFKCHHNFAGWLCWFPLLPDAGQINPQ